MNIEELRKELINNLEAAYFVGGYGGAILEVEEIKNASVSQLVEIAKRYGYELIEEEEQNENKPQDEYHR